MVLHETRKAVSSRRKFTPTNYDCRRRYTRHETSAAIFEHIIRETHRLTLKASGIYIYNSDEKNLHGITNRNKREEEEKEDRNGGGGDFALRGSQPTVCSRR